MPHLPNIPRDKGRRYGSEISSETSFASKAKSVRVKICTLVDAMIKPAVHGFKAHVGADVDPALVEEIAVTSASVSDRRAEARCTWL